METNIKIYRQLLKQDLPGYKAHIQMMPEGRVFKPKNANTKKSAVNIVTFLKNNQLFFILTQRTESLSNHSGQISLPGGSKDKADKDLWETAKRETFEEIGLNISDENFIGKLSSLYIDVSNFFVQPYISFFNKEPILHRNTIEAENIFKVNFNEFFEKNNILYSSKIIKKIKIKYPYYVLESQQVWGATAMILQEFFLVYKKLYNI